MNLDGIVWVEFSDHAVGNLGRVPLSEGQIANRLKSGRGVFFRDTENGQWRYDIYLPHEGVIAPFEVQLWDRGKVAVVLTVFEITKKKKDARYHHTDRFEFVKKWS